jgi:hypothetical protein
MELNLDWQKHTSALWPEVSYELRPLRVWAFEELLGYWHRQGAPDESGGAARTASRHGAELMALAKKVLPEHVRALEGVVVIQDGRRVPAGLDALCEEAGLMALTGEILSGLVAISAVPPSAEKN